MFKIAICDDDEKIIYEIRKAIEEYKDVKFSINTYNSGEELLSAGEQFDVIFLDIEMNNMNGIETAKAIRKYDKDVKIIYVTSYTDYMNLAFSVHAFGYLNKPIKKEDIHNQLDEVLAYLSEEIEEIIEFITVEGVVRIALTDICYFEYINRRVKLKTLTESYIIKETIGNIANRMKEYGFCMPHKSFTVNLFNVKSIKGYDIFMMDGAIIPLSQKKSTEFRDEFNMFLEKRIMA
ncbi:LytR/AlgR family response regulator transcription factor [Clostridium massiliamazoniense]|uniref:LytR/AlgR family response regulator transcription factor n=1 Tax=Clostridium massiliamazoniense TaxID=1347366 RepID=UPI0006D7F0C3|nr:LytTR family DNA-binding domain-containing protein [Clostridium massiliamazoniense]